jgi:hypothetical protein
MFAVRNTLTRTTHFLSTRSNARVTPTYRALLFLAVSSTVLAQSSSPVYSDTHSNSSDCGCAAATTPASSSSSFFSTMADSGKDNKKPNVGQFSAEVITDIRTGEKKTLGEIWKDKPAVLAFLRRLG